jgi:hypothetical protein
MNLLINPLLFKFQISSQMSICLTPFPKKNSIYRVGGGGVRWVVTWRWRARPVEGEGGPVTPAAGKGGRAQRSSGGREQVGIGTGQ